MSIHTIRFTLNGQERVIENVPSHMTLLELLRERLGLTGTKDGCGEGDCGACTIIMDGLAVNACLVLAAQADGHDIVTIEGLEQEGQPDPLQCAFVEYGAVQCGYCTPGLLMSAKALLTVNPYPSEDDIRRAIAGNLCRCTGYISVLQAIRAASSRHTHKGETDYRHEEGAEER